MELDEVKNRILSCVDCPLYDYGYGKVVGTYPKSRKAIVAFVMDFPTHAEGMIGLPLTDRVGELLNPAIDEAGIEREDLALLHCIKCCTPRNRYPAEYEAILCQEWITMQLTQLRPDIILAMGERALSILLDHKSGIFTEEDRKYESVVLERYRCFPAIANYPDSGIALIYATYSPNIQLPIFSITERKKIEGKIRDDILEFGKVYKRVKAIYEQDGKDIQKGE